MSTEEVARSFDDAGKVLEAVAAYEAALSDGELSGEGLINLAAIYFRMTDIGYAGAHHIPRGLERIAYSRSLDLLDLARACPRTEVEAEFWLMYVPHAALDDPLDGERCRSLAEGSDSLVPWLGVWLATGGREGQAGVRMLLNLVQVPHTEKERYIVSMIGDEGWRREPFPRRRASS